MMLQLCMDCHSTVRMATAYTETSRPHTFTHHLDGRSLTDARSLVYMAAGRNE